MPTHLAALQEGPDIPVGRFPVLVGRHPGCDTRLDSIRVSRHHCCLAEDDGEIVIRDLGSTNGIRINGQRVAAGRLRPGDELSIAHLRYRVDDGRAQQATPPGSPGEPEGGPLMSRTSGRT
jgi:predicted component of type VI protein secretion system